MLLEAPVKPVVPAELRNMDPVAFGGQCARCSVQHEQLYVRRNRSRYCIHCVDLELTGPNDTGRGGGARKLQRPYNQPSPVMMHGSVRPCLWCDTLAAPVYQFNAYRFHACGWGCAGQWMDWVVDLVLKPKREARELAEAEAYVRQSLGLTDAATVPEDQPVPEPAVPDDEGAPARR